MPQDALSGETLYSLSQLCSDKRFNVRRTYRTLLLWAEEGAKNLSGDTVRLECAEVSGVKHSSFEAFQRFIAAQNAQTLKCHCLGGCLDGRMALCSDHLQRVTSGELVRGGKVSPPPGSVPADHLYYKIQWVDSKNRLRPFLVWSQCENSEQRIRAIVENA